MVQGVVVLSVLFDHRACTIPLTMIAGLPLIAFLVMVGFSIYKSTKRRTILYTLGAMSLLVGLALSVAQVVPALNTDLVGAATFDAMPGVSTLVTSVHSQKNKTGQEKS
jgi:disulfide bond formation protein DsbB